VRNVACNLPDAIWAKFSNFSCIFAQDHTPVAYLPQASISPAMDGITADRLGHSEESPDPFVTATST